MPDVEIRLLNTLIGNSPETMSQFVRISNINFKVATVQNAIPHTIATSVYISQVNWLCLMCSLHTPIFHFPCLLSPRSFVYIHSLDATVYAVHCFLNTVL